jgi:Lectin C-type domain
VEKHYGIVVAVVLSFAIEASADVWSGPVVNPTNGHTYYLLSSQTWTNAESEAQSLGGHLTTINDLTENDWVANQFQQAASGLWAWIGLNDAEVEGTFVWVSGDPSAYRNWYQGPPVSQDDYVAIVFERNNQWINYPNSNNKPALVEVVPEPAGTSLLLIASSALLRRKRRST